MEPEQAKELGAYLRRQRESKGVSARALAAAVGVDMTQIIRLEQGGVASPKATVLGGIADRLGLPLADVFGLAGYPLPKNLPSFRPYMRAKYKELPDEAVAELEAFLTRLTKKHGLKGPRRGEDEHQIM